MVSRLVIVLALGIVVASAMPAAGRAGLAGTLQLHAKVGTKWRLAACPASTPSPHGVCYATQGQAIVPGLGQTTEQYTLVVDDLTAHPTTVHLTAAITVAGKGVIDASALTHSSWCDCSGSTLSLAFTITGGTGAYAGAQGSGTVLHEQYATGSENGLGKDAWSGTLSVPGYTFDTTPPVIHGAISKTVKAPPGTKRIRVRYKVTADDRGEGSLPVTCSPRSGRFFKLGRTTVRCAVTDANGNTAKTRFKVRVTRG